MDVNILDNVDVGISEESVYKTFSGIKEFDNSEDLEESGMDIKETAVYVGDLKKNSYKMLTNEDDVEKVYENITSETIKKDPETVIEEETITISENINNEIQISYNNGLECDLPTRRTSYFYCNDCEEEHQGFCPRCSKVTHILHNISKTSTDSLTETVPIGILEIRDATCDVGVFTLRTIPEGILFGPFEDLTSLPTTNGTVWRIKNRKLNGTRNGNWMQVVNCARKVLFQNLEILQYTNSLYFRSIREINEGDELLVYFNEEYVSTNSVKESYYCPLVEYEFGKVYACTLCCLGFRYDVHLVEHKIQCPHSMGKVSAEEIIQCSHCNIFLVEGEYLQHHKIYCSKNHMREVVLPVETQQVNGPMINSTAELHPRLPIPNTSNSDICDNISRKSVRECVLRKRKHDTNAGPSLITTLNAKPIEEQIRVGRTEQKQNLKLQVKSKDNRLVEEYQCAQCKMKQKASLTRHLPRDADKFKCDQCQYKGHKPNLNKYLIHDVDKSEIHYNCDKCEFQTQYKNSLEAHLITHFDSTSGKIYRCNKCEYQTHLERRIQLHKRTHPSAKKYSCDKCDFRTIYFSTLEVHRLIHKRPTFDNHYEYKCDKCEFHTHYKVCIEKHQLTHADLTSGKKYKCKKCNYQTNKMSCLKVHRRLHNKKKYKCGKCEFQTRSMISIKEHQLEHAAPTSDKKYKCDICEFQTDYEKSLKTHQYKHAHPTSPNTFKCDKCEFDTKYEHSLERHKLTHNMYEKKYKCSQCQYETHRKACLKAHFVKHDVK